MFSILCFVANTGNVLQTQAHKVYYVVYLYTQIPTQNKIEDQAARFSAVRFYFNLNGGEPLRQIRDFH